MSRKEPARSGFFTARPHTIRLELLVTARLVHTGIGLDDRNGESNLAPRFQLHVVSIRGDEDARVLTGYSTMKVNVRKRADLVDRGGVVSPCCHWIAIWIAHSN